MTLPTSLTRLLDLSLPIIQGPMAGGVSTPALVAAVSAGGGLGSLGAAYLTPEQVVAAARAVRQATDRPFAINLFCPQPAPAQPDEAALQRALAAVGSAHRRLGLPAPVPPQPVPEPFEAQFAAVLESGARVFSFTFGIAPATAIEAAHRRGMKVIGTASTVAEALALEHAGVDAVVALGSESGGHRATFQGAFEDALIGSIALVPQMVDAVKIPVIASGGIMDGRGLAAALCLGAAGVQMGTAFLTTKESGAPQPHKAAVLAAREDQTRLTRAFSGRPARGVVNTFMEQAADVALDFPLQNTLTRGMRNAAAQQGRAEYLSLWSGQAPRLARAEGAVTVLERTAREARQLLGRLAAPG